MEHDLFYTASVTLQSLQKPYCGLKPLVDPLLSHGAAFPVTYPVPCLGAQLKSEYFSLKFSEGKGPCRFARTLTVQVPFLSAQTGAAHSTGDPSQPDSV